MDRANYFVPRTLQEQGTLLLVYSKRKKNPLTSIFLELEDAWFSIPIMTTSCQTRHRKKLTENGEKKQGEVESMIYDDRAYIILAERLRSKILQASIA